MFKLHSVNSTSAKQYKNNVLDKLLQPALGHPLSRNAILSIRKMFFETNRIGEPPIILIKSKAQNRQTTTSQRELQQNQLLQQKLRQLYQQQQHPSNRAHNNASYTSRQQKRPTQQTQNLKKM